MGFFRKGKSHTVAKFSRTDLLFVILERRKTLSYSQINTVMYVDYTFPTESQEPNKAQNILMCVNTEISKTINFPFVPNGKLIILGVPIL